MAKKPMLLSDLFHETLKDIYFAENKILKTLPKMAKAAQSKDLAESIHQASSGNRRPSKAAQSGLQDYRQAGTRKNVCRHQRHH